MAQKFSVKQEIFNYIKDKQGVLESANMATWSDYDAWFEAMSSMEQVDIVLAMINNLETLDPFLDGISRETESAQVVEEYMIARFNKGTLDVAGKAYKPILQDLNIPYDDYTCAVAFSEKMALKDERGTINKILNAIIPAYQLKLRGLALKSILILPTDQSKYQPCFWRDTSTFTDLKNRLTPHPNGLLQFEDSESHYLAEANYAKDIVKKLEKKVQSKGYGRNGLVVMGAESTWESYRNSYTVDELKSMELIRMTPDFAPENNRSTYVAMPDTDFPVGYFFAYDPNVEFVAHKIADNENLKGLKRMFSTFEEARTNHRAEFKFFENGFGVVEKGAGAVMYIGGADYVNPNLSAI